jgi:hypothetical protein
MSENIIYVASIDPGKKNFAFSIEEIDISKCKNITSLGDIHKFSNTVLAENIDVTKDTDQSKYLDIQIFVNLTAVLDKYRSYWDKCSVILIEKQMSFGRNKNNTMALKVAQHCLSYFIFMYSNFKKIIEYPAYYKTQILDAPKKMDKPARKKWSVQKVTEILSLRETDNILEKRKKKDDISDCILMNLTYAYQVYVLKKDIC